MFGITQLGKVQFGKIQFVSSLNINNNTKLSPRYSSFSFMEIQKAIEERNPLLPRNKSKVILLAQIQM